MEENKKLLFKTICCTCLSRDRDVIQLIKVPNGINNLYSLLTYDTEAFREGFYADSATQYICWECRQLLDKFRRFRGQVCKAQRVLGCEGSKLNKDKLTSLSHLKRSEIQIYDSTATVNGTATNFIDCGIPTNFSECSDDDIPLSALNTLKNCSKKKGVDREENKVGFTVNVLTEMELQTYRNKLIIDDSFANSEFKCVHCIVSFKSEEDYIEHMPVHEQAPNHQQCDVCMMYISTDKHSSHVKRHYLKYTCKNCDCSSYTNDEIQNHVDSDICRRVERKRRKVETRKQVKAGSKPRYNKTLKDTRTPLGFQCTDCEKYFDTKNRRWKHIQSAHREGFKCTSCDKRFAFKNNLTRHERTHNKESIPREKCPNCNRLIRKDLYKVHLKIHSDRKKYYCIECAKEFVCKASYEHHLKYTAAHTTVDLLKYKCSVCPKGYKSLAELRDHVNYVHKGTSIHKCPVCDKLLATRRCVRRHVGRAHQGRREGRTCVCQICGRTFRDKKSLIEHERIHTGATPLECKMCHTKYRHSSALYVHCVKIHGLKANRPKLTA